jgi:uncharacterized protein YceH (UPF0502 family)
MAPGNERGRRNVKVELSADEARVIGALIEKEITTPDQYPLSLNALTNACNQKSNRDPVVSWGEAGVQQLLDGLSRRALAVDRSGFGSRVPKYRHLFCNTAFGSLKFSPQELAIVCELLLRGPQTPGELRGRASRMCPFADVGEVEATLDRLMNREDGPFLARLVREPGRRESRYAQLFTGALPTESVDAAPPLAAAVRPATASVADDRLESLEKAVQRLEMEVAELKRKMDP